MTPGPGSAEPASATASAPLLRLESIQKRFGATEALRGVNFSLASGEIHALLGENGAGKSTLMKIAFGLVAPDSGRILVAGRATRIASPIDARMLGIGMVHQHFTAIPTFTVAENVALAAGWPPRPAGVLAALRRLMEETGIQLDPEARAGDLSAGLKQRLEVLKAAAANARILLLDEPTSVLSPPDTAAFLQLIVRLRSQGISSVLITHKLEEALRIADRVTILRRGEVVRSGAISDESAGSLARAMLGAAPADEIPAAPAPSGPVRVTASNLAVPALTSGGTGLRSATLEVRGGEVLGVAAVEGNGQRELLRAIAGLATPTAGTVEVDGPVSFIPEDRTREGLLGDLTLTENLVLSRGDAGPWIRWGFIAWEVAASRVRELIQAFGVRASGPESRASSLSGGNQQRFVIATAAERGPRVIVAENPARGLDFRATDEVYGRLRRAAAAGAAIVLHVPDLDDLLAVADRVVVVAAGRSQGVPRGAARDQIGALMLGLEAEGPTE